MTLTAAWAKNGPGRVTHLYTDDDDRSLCGTQRGLPTSFVICKSCLHRYAQTPEGRRIARAAADQAIAHHVNSATSLINRPSTLEQLARHFEAGTQDDP